MFTAKTVGGEEEQTNTFTHTDTHKLTHTHIYAHASMRESNPHRYICLITQTTHTPTDAYAYEQTQNISHKLVLGTNTHEAQTQQRGMCTAGCSHLLLLMNIN